MKKRKKRKGPFYFLPCVKHSLKEEGKKERPEEKEERGGWGEESWEDKKGRVRRGRVVANMY